MLNWISSLKKKFRGISKSAGFSLPELLLVLLILGILTSITFPNIDEWQRNEQFGGSADTIFQAIEITRTNALSEKKCPNGEPSESWSTKINNSATTKNVEVWCRWSDTLADQELVHPSGGETSDYTFADRAVVFEPDPLGIFVTNAAGTPTRVDTTELVFLNALFTPVIHDDSSFTQLRVSLQSAVSTVRNRTICLNKSAGFPFISTDNITCSES